MTHAMSDQQLDRAIRGFLARQAEDLAAAPTAEEMAWRITQRVASRRSGLGVTPRLALIVLAGLLLALAGALIGAGWVRPQLGPLSYEAVFLRLEVTESNRVVVAVGVDNAGREREVARLAGAWAAYDIGEGRYLPPMGAVSPGGLLAIPTARDASLTMDWHIRDLRRGAEEPLLIAGASQFIEALRDRPYFEFDPRGGAFWGPGDRLALLWYPSGDGPVELRLTFVDPRTGPTSPVPVPAGRAVMPFWASDGSGVAVTGASALESPPVDLRQVLRPDGTITDIDPALLEPSCRTADRSGAELVIADGRLERRRPDGTVTTLPRVDAWYACLAPDDSTVVVMLNTGAVAGRTGVMLAPDGDAWLEIQGNFAGWMEVPE